MKRLVGGSLLVLVAAVIPARAVDWYVDAWFLQTSSTYSPAARGGGGSALSYASIQAAVTAMQPGDTLYLRGGQYNERGIDLSRKQGFPGAWFTVKSYPGEWARVHGGYGGGEAHVFLGQSPAYWRFEYFEVTGGGSRPDRLTGDRMRGNGFIFRPARHITFHRLYVHDNYGAGGDNHAGIEIENGGVGVGGGPGISW